MIVERIFIITLQHRKDRLDKLTNQLDNFGLEGFFFVGCFRICFPPFFFVGVHQDHECFRSSEYCAFCHYRPVFNWGCEPSFKLLHTFVVTARWTYLYRFVCVLSAGEAGDCPHVLSVLRVGWDESFASWTDTHVYLFAVDPVPRFHLVLRVSCWFSLDGMCGELSPSHPHCSANHWSCHMTCLLYVTSDIAHPQYLQVLILYTPPFNLE